MDKLAIDWKMGEGSFEFTPGDIEFTVTQRPDVVIKYWARGNCGPQRCQY